MTEGITYDPLGTVDVTFDDETYHLGRPKLKQWKYFTRQIEETTKKTRERLAELGKEVAEASNAIEEAVDSVLSGVLEKANARLQEEDATELDRKTQERAWQDVYEAAPEELRQRYDEAEEQVRQFAATPFYERSSEIIRAMFDQIGDRKLPKDLDDWPVWLATDVRLPGQILAHWREAPKASGANGQTP